MDYTPVELVDNIWFKREDKYAPYGDDFISGGKIRQCRDLVEKNLDYIHEFCDSTIATAASIHSPQSPIEQGLRRSLIYTVSLGLVILRLRVH